MKKQAVTQKSKIENILRKGRLLTPTQAKAYGITKPSARVRELRVDGVQIESTINKSGKFAWKLGCAVKAVTGFDNFGGAAVRMG